MPMNVCLNDGAKRKKKKKVQAKSLVCMWEEEREEGKEENDAMEWKDE